jgi:hypothetical protein
MQHKSQIFGKDTSKLVDQLISKTGGKNNVVRISIALPEGF